MGLFINPTECTKGEWLKDHQQECLVNPPEWEDIPKDCLLVCHVDNATFTAAGIIYNLDELKRATRLGDHRPKMWYIVKKDDLRRFYPEL